MLAYPAWVGEEWVRVGPAGTREELVALLAEPLARALGAHSVESGQSFHARVKCTRAYRAHAWIEALERAIGAVGVQQGLEVDFTAPDIVLLGVVTPAREQEGARDGAPGPIEEFQLHLGRMLVRPTRGRRRARVRTRANQRPYLQVGSLNPPFSRAMGNMAACPPGGIFLDPMCGAGGILLEVAGGSRHAVGCDVDRNHVKGCRANVSSLVSPRAAHVIHADAFSAPLRPGSIAGIATDLPYGRSTSTRGRSGVSLVEGTLRAGARLLRTGGRLCVSLADWLVPQTFTLERVLPASLHALFSTRQVVHKSLTRLVHVVAAGGHRGPHA